MRKRALLPIVLLAVVACGDDSDNNEGASVDRPCFNETTVPAATTGAPGTTAADDGAPGTNDPGTTAGEQPGDDGGGPTTSGTPPATMDPATAPSETTAPPTGTTAASDAEDGEGEPAGFGGPHVASPDDDDPDDSVEDIELEPVTGESTVPPTTVAPKPEVAVPEEAPTEDIETTDIEDGDGREARDGDYVEVRYVGVRIDDGEEFDSNYDQETALPVTVGSGQVIPGFDQGLVGMREGAIRQIDIPADLAYGEADGGEGDGEEDGGDADDGAEPSNTEGPAAPSDSAGDEGDAGAGEEGGTEDDGRPRGPLSFVVEVEQLVRRPNVENVVTPSWCSPELVIDDRQEGSGDAAEEGDSIRAHVITLRGDNLHEIESTWGQGQPATILLEAGDPSQGSIVEGLVEGIEGMQAGGRRVITIPPHLAYGSEGLPQVGLPQDTDFIVVIDLIEVIKDG